MSKNVKEKPIKERINDLVQEAYREYEITVEPLYPQIMVRVLPRSQTSQSGKIVLPEKQNKPLIEGVVLATFKPIMRKISDDRGTRMQEMVPSVSIGDHVLFPHHEGQPVRGFDISEYRLIKDDVIIGRLDYDREKGKKIPYAYPELESLTTSGA